MMRPAQSGGVTVEEDRAAFSCEVCGSTDLKVTGVARGRTFARCRACGASAAIFECRGGDPEPLDDATRTAALALRLKSEARRRQP
ncbi:MAG TPA: hypothetical protein VGO03_07375 [Acidimicrobiia bacterium]|jgi:hypothetical protein